MSIAADTHARRRRNEPLAAWEPLFCQSVNCWVACATAIGLGLLKDANMKVLASLLVLIAALSGCISSSSPPAPAHTTTVIVPEDGSKTTIVCQDGTKPPCN